MMADWTVTLSRPVLVNGTARTLETQTVVEASTHNLAVPLGIDAIFKSEAASGYQLVPKEAVDYWNQWRATGGYLYEFQTEIEGRWGISFGISEIKDVNDDPRPQPTHRNGHQPAPVGELPDLNSMLQNHLQVLQIRSSVLSDQLQRAQAEFDRINSDIMRITAMIGPLPTPPVLPPPPTPIEQVREKVQRKLAAKRKSKEPDASSVRL